MTSGPGLFSRWRSSAFGEAVLLEERLDAILVVLQVCIAAFRRLESVIDKSDSPKFREEVLQSLALKAEVLLDPVRRRGLPVLPRVVEVPENFGDDLHSRSAAVGGFLHTPTPEDRFRWLYLALPLTCSVPPNR